MNVYIAGPMTGWPQFNFPAFDKARDVLTASGKYDRIASPADMCRADGFDPSKTTGNEDLASLGLDLDIIIFRDLCTVLECDAIFMLDGWRNSKGATAEHAVAVWAGKKIIRNWCQ